MRLVLAFGCALLSGCTGVRTPATARATAPTLGDRAGLRGTHNAADPNAPFTSLVAAPRLTAREPVLDTTNAPWCQPTELNLFESRARANGDRHTLRLTLQNLGAACRLGGFPAVSLLGADGRVLGKIQIARVSDEAMTASLIAAPSGGKPVGLSLDAPSPSVLLSAQSNAAFELGWTSGPACLTASRIAVSAPMLGPGTSPPVIISRPLVVCEDRLLITAVAPAEND